VTEDRVAVLRVPLREELDDLLVNSVDTGAKPRDRRVRKRN
jgi:hypothetical protein